MKPCFLIILSALLAGCGNPNSVAVVTIYANDGKVIRQWTTHHNVRVYRGCTYFLTDDGKEVALTGQVTVEEIK